MSRWSWSAADCAHVGVDAFDITLDGKRAGRLEIQANGTDIVAGLNAFCTALTGVTATPPRGRDSQADAPPDTRPLTDKQRTAIHIGMAELGYKERPQRLATISAFLGREVGSTNELTRDEAGAVLGRIDEKRNQPRNVA